MRASRTGIGSAALALAVLGAAPPAADDDAAIARRLQAHVAFLADDALRGRDTGSAEFEIAARYVASQLAALGLEPAGEGGTWFQQVPLRRHTIEPDSAVIRLQRGAASEELAWAEDYVMGGDPMRAVTTVTAPVVFAGYGVVAPQLGWDDYAGLDVSGKIVVLLRGAPARFPHDERAFYSSGRTKEETAVERGAVGMLSLRTNEQERKLPWERVARRAGQPGLSWRHADGGVQDYFPELRGSATLSREGAAKLFAGAARSLDEVLADEERGLVRGFPLPVVATLARRTSHEDLTAPNVAARWPGADAWLRDELVVYSAHLDHLGVGPEVDGDAIYNGLYDNAMGVAVLLEAARELAAAPPARRSFLFLAVCGEEKGLLGSDYFAHHPTVPPETLVADVNLDMPLFLSPLEELVAFGAEHSTLEEVVRAAAAAHGWRLAADPMPEEVLFIRSDQYSFVRRGVPSIFLVTGGAGSAEPLADWQGFLASHYHMPSDEPGLPVDWPSAARFVRVNAAIGRAVADAEARPTWKPGDFFGERFARGRGNE